MVFSIPWYIALLVSLPETYLYLLLGFKLYNLDINEKQLLTFSIFNGIFSFFLRQIPMFFGLHTLLTLIVLSVLASVFLKIRFLKSFVVVLTGILITGIIQSMVIPIIFGLFSLNIEMLSLTPWLIFPIFIPSGILMLILYFIISKFDFLLYDLKFNFKKDDLSEKSQ